MRPRRNIIELFSTFVKLTEDHKDHFEGWLTQPRLKRSMEIGLQEMSASNPSESFWVLYWHKQWQLQSNSLAREHLIAYLQEQCYWAAHDHYKRFSSVQYTFSDYFQMAIAGVDKVLRCFDPNRGSQLKNYASRAFKSFITGTLRECQEVDVCTDWALLRRTSPKKLKSSLEYAGLSREEIERYRLAWICFNTLYVPTRATKTQRLPDPNSATWQAIADLYNDECRRQLNLSDADVSRDILEEWLKQSADYIRSYVRFSKDRATISLNELQIGQDSGERLDSLASLDQPLLDQVIVQQWQSQLKTIVTNALAEFEPEIQTIFKLYYGDDLHQVEIAQQRETKQYTISRRLSRGIQLLLKALAQESQKNLGVALTSETLKDMNRVLEDCLRNYYQGEKLE